MEQDIDKVVDIIIEVENYLYDWTTSYTGEYLPISYDKWHKNFLIWFEEKQHDDYIKEYKEDVINKKFDLPMHTLQLSNWHKSELYKKHKDNVERFEEKYKLQ